MDFLHFISNREDYIPQIPHLPNYRIINNKNVPFVVGLRAFLFGITSGFKNPFVIFQWPEGGLWA
jgi:hypothetical protein